jgi:hypothetical protein
MKARFADLFDLFSPTSSTVESALLESMAADDEDAVLPFDVAERVWTAMTRSRPRGSGSARHGRFRHCVVCRLVVIVAVRHRDYSWSPIQERER